MTSVAKLRQKLLTDRAVQADIAARMGTSQSVVARLESARHMPTFDMVARYAAAIGRRIDIHLVPAGKGHEVMAHA